MVRIDYGLMAMIMGYAGVGSCMGACITFSNGDGQRGDKV